MNNPNLARLQPYPFEKLAELFSGINPKQPNNNIALSIGEPKHAPPHFVLEILSQTLSQVSVYPKTKGLYELRCVIAEWLENRYQLNAIDPETHIIPVNGTREALFSIVQAMADNTKPNGLVVCPNPFYQIYEGAALLAGLTPHYLAANAQGEIDYDNVDDDIWKHCQVLFVCSPNNPTGKVTSETTWKKLIQLAKKHHFILAADECYSELYFDEGNPPCGLLEACKNMGNDNYDNCLVFHSLSKRSNLPGLRSGFVAGDAKLLQQYLLYRTYHGCAMPEHTQLASIAAWSDETHVKQNRQLYREKFTRVLDIISPTLNVSMPDGAFYLWANTPIDDTEFAQRLYEQQNVTVLPGQYLSREQEGINPGKNYVRIALVAELNQCIEAIERINAFCQRL